MLTSEVNQSSKPIAAMIGLEKRGNRSTGINHKILITIACLKPTKIVLSVTYSTNCGKTEKYAKNRYKLKMAFQSIFELLFDNFCFNVSIKTLYLMIKILLLTLGALNDLTAKPFT